jgi:hypothetical protein
VEIEQHHYRNIGGNNGPLTFIHSVRLLFCEVSAVEALMEGTQTVSEQEQSEQQQKVEQERSKLVTYTVKLPNGAKFTRLNPVNN